ncbi:hypothetical protein AAVH_02325 [Aphelenchoides avenae]|nr:hypothetical protein AAVH_02325 [Aphelenchus avenae]
MASQHIFSRSRGSATLNYVASAQSVKKAQTSRSRNAADEQTVDVVPESDQEDADIRSPSKASKRPHRYDDVSVVNETQSSVVNETQPSIVHETQRSVLYETQVSVVPESQPDDLQDSLDAIVLGMEMSISGLSSSYLAAQPVEPPKKRARVSGGQQKLESFFQSQGNQKIRPQVTGTQATVTSQRTLSPVRRNTLRNVESPPRASAKSVLGRSTVGTMPELKGIGLFPQSSSISDEKPPYMDIGDMKKFKNKSIVMSASLVRRDKPPRVSGENFNNFRKAPQGRFFFGKQLPDIVTCTRPFIPKCPAYSAKRTTE